MAQYGFHVDLRKCTGCHACAIACKTENNTPIGVDWRQVITQEGGTYPRPVRLFVTMACNHCDHPACLESCPVDAISKRSTDESGKGIVLIDQEKCIGCKRCTWACPYGAPRMNAATNKAEKCTLCVHRLDAGLGLVPACVSTCVGNALHFGPIDELPGTDQIDGFANPVLTGPNVRFTV